MILFTVGVFYLCWLLISKPINSGVLNCGLFGLNANRALDEKMLENLKILGFFNQARGTDSCGYFNGEDIVKGVDKEKEWFSFVVNNKVKLPEESSNVFIGHTRQATWGKHTAPNAHPFNINGRMVLAHNGTLDNMYSMCCANEIETKDIDVDSEMLGHLIDKLGWSVLEKYKGAAALLIYKADEENSLYIFHGKSKKTQYAEVLEERPLFYLMAEEGIYLSSLKSSLEWINKEKNDETIKTVPYNTVIKIQNGVFSDEVVLIDREETNVYVPYVAPTTYKPDYVSNRSQTPPAKQIKSLLTIVSPKINIERETLPKKSDTVIPSIFYWKGRYWYSKDLKLCEGSIAINKAGNIVSMDDITQKRVETCFFYRGVMIDTENHYRYLMNELSSTNTSIYLCMNNSEVNFALAISRYAKFPVTNIKTESMGIHSRESWWIDGKYAHGLSITPKFGDRHYHFKTGSLINITGEISDEPFLLKTKEEESKSDSAILLPFPVPVKEPPKRGEESVFEFPKEMMEFYNVFKRTYVAEASLKEALVGIAHEALKSYAEDLAQNIFKVTPTDSLIGKIMEETILSAIYTNSTLSDVMEPQLQSALNYVYDAYEDFIDEQDAENNEETDVPDYVPDEGERAVEDVRKYLQEDTSIDQQEGEIQAFKGFMVQDEDLQTLRDEEDEQASSKIKEILDKLSEIKEISQELTILNNSPAALDYNRETDIMIDSVTTCYSSLAIKYKLKGLAGEIKKVQKIY